MSRSIRTACLFVLLSPVLFYISPTPICFKDPDYCGSFHLFVDSYIHSTLKSTCPSFFFLSICLSNVRGVDILRKDEEEFLVSCIT